MQRNFYIIFLSLLVGIAFAVGIIHYLNPFYKNDFYRNVLLINYLQSKKSNETDLILFGNSIVMNGLDANLIDEKRNVNCLNAATSGQTLQELVFYLDILPPKTKQVVYFTGITEVFQKKEPVINDLILVQNTLYRPPLHSDLISILSNFNLEKYEAINKKKNYEKEKILFFSWLDFYFRTLLNKNRTNNSYMSDFKSPVMYNIQLSQKEIDKRVEVFINKNNEINEKPSADFFKKMSIIKHYLNTKNIDFKVVVLPIHPNTKFISSTLLNELETISRQNNFTIFLNVLEKNEFRDHAHPNELGRKKLTNLFLEIL